VRERSKSRVQVKDLEVHDTVVLAGPETIKNDDIYSLSFMGESETLFGEILEARESPEPGKIKMRVETSKFPYLLEVDRSQEFLTISPKLTPASQVKAKSKIILRGEAAPEELGGKPLHGDLVRSYGAVADVLRVRTLSDGCIKITVKIARRKKFRFIVEPSRVLEIL
jgi:hypothetical protein